jgi:pyruvate kinase
MQNIKQLALKHIDEEIAKVLSLGPNQQPKIVAVSFPQKVWTLQEIRREIQDETAFGLEQMKIWSKTHEAIENERAKIKARLLTS